MKKTCLLIIIALLALQTQAQDYTPKWGPPCYDEEGIIIPPRYRFLGMDGDYYYMIAFNKTESLLLKYDLNHQKVSQKIIDIRYEMNSLSSRDVFHHPFQETKSGKFLILQDFGPQSQINILATKLEDGNLSPIKKIHTYTSEYKVGFLFLHETKNNLRRSHFDISEDKSKVVMSTLANDKENNYNVRQSIAVFDEDLNLLWEKNHTYEYDGNDLKIKDIKVNNKGEVYTLGRIPEKKTTTSVSNFLRYDYILFKMTKDGQEEFTIKLPENHIITSASMYILNDPKQKQEFKVAGFYLNKNHFLYRIPGYERFTGTFIGPNNTPKGLTNYQLHPAETTLNYEYKPKELIRLKNGTYVFLAEFMDVLNGYTDPPVLETNALLLKHFTANGDLSYSTVIDKRFYSRSLNYLSYAIEVDNNKIYLTFNNRKTAKERKVLKKAGRNGPYKDLVIFNGESSEIEFNDILFSYEEANFYNGAGICDFEKGKLLIRGKPKKQKGFYFSIIDLE